MQDPKEKLTKKGERWKLEAWVAIKLGESPLVKEEDEEEGEEEEKEERER